MITGDYAYGLRTNAWVYPDPPHTIIRDEDMPDELRPQDRAWADWADGIITGAGSGPNQKPVDLP